MTDISRRRFLEDSMLAVTAAGAASVGVAGALPRQAVRQVGPNEKLGVCVVGIGGRGWGSHCKEWCDDPRTEIRYLCDPDVDQGTEVRADRRTTGRRSAKVHHGYAQSFRRPGGGRRQQRVHESLACPLWRLGDAGQETLLSREAHLS